MLRWMVVLALTILVAGLASSCSRNDRPCVPLQADGTPIDPNLMAFLSRARAAHHLADLREETEPLLAVQTLDSVVVGPIPNHRGTISAEASEVIADTQARIAELESRLLHFDTALARIEAGLRLVPEVGYFRGRLFETRGIVEQRRANELRRLNDPAAAESARTNALAAFETAMQIQAEVIRRTPEDPSARGLTPSPKPTTDHEEALPKQPAKQGFER